MKSLLRKAHRWLGLIVALQILAWMASGFYFSLYPIQEIRGEHLTREPESLGGDMGQLDVPRIHIERALSDHFDDPWALEHASLTMRNGRLLWLVRGEASGDRFSRLLTAEGGVLPILSREEAERRATWWLLEPAPVVTSEWVPPGAGGTDFRARDVAAWRVDFGGAEPVSLFIEPWTGDLLARRTARWRLFDFMWMLHIMDYDSRDDFNHPLLQAAAIGGLLVALSGVLFWFMTRRKTRRRKRA